MPREPKSFDFRESTRTPLRAEVQLQFDRDEDSIGHSANLSPGGMFVTVRDPKPIGTLLRFVVELPEAEPVRGYGEVVWIRVKYHGPDRPSGMGIRFRHLEDEGKERIEGYILQMTSEPEGADVGDETVAASAESTVAQATPLVAVAVEGVAAEVGSGAPAEETATVQAPAGEEPMAEIWESEPVAAGSLPSETDELVPMPSLGEELDAPTDDETGDAALDADASAEPYQAELLLAPTEGEELRAEDVASSELPSSSHEDIDTAIHDLEQDPGWEEARAGVEAAAEELAEDGPRAETGDDTVDSTLTGDTLSVDTAVIEDPDLLDRTEPFGTTVMNLPEPEAPTPKPAAPYAPDTDELSAAFGDLYPGGPAEAIPAQEPDSEDVTTSSTLELPSFDEGPDFDETGDLSDTLPRAAPWLTTPMPDPELEETMDGVVDGGMGGPVGDDVEAAAFSLSEADPTEPAVPELPALDPIEPEIEFVEEMPEAVEPEAWEPERREAATTSSGLPPGSARTSIAGTAVAEEPWKKTFFGMPSRTFFRALTVVGVLAVLAILLTWGAGWLADREDEGDEIVASTTSTMGGASASSDGSRPAADSEEPDVPGAADEPDDGSGEPAGDTASGDDAVADASGPGPGASDGPADTAVTAAGADKYFRAPVLSPEEGGLDLSRVQLEEGMTVGSLLAQHESAATPSRMRNVTDILWRRLGNRTVVTVTGDGTLDATRFSHERMAGAQPRELVKITGIRGDFPQPQTQAGTPQLSVVRLGYHQGEQRELHVVLDLPRADIRVERIDLTGAGLEIHLSAP